MTLAKRLRPASPSSVIWTEKARAHTPELVQRLLVAFSIHMTLLGEAGLRRLARVNHANAVQLADRLGAIAGVEIVNTHFFNEFTLRTPRPAAELVEALARRGVIGGLPASRLLPGAGLDDCVIVASTETNTDADRAAYAQALAECLR